jgi:hypothetical protein
MESYMKKLLICAALLLSACGVESEVSGPPIRETDKHLKCPELLLEMNDAKFYLAQAEKKKGLNVRNVAWPVGYPSTVSSANDAIAISQERIAYLSNIYKIKGCNDPYPESR